MSSISKPLLASAVEDINKLKFPLGATPKIDGIRCLKIDGRVVTRKFKQFPNHHIRETLEKILPDNIDGEILVDGKTFNEVQSLCMTEEGTPDFTFYAFDYVRTDLNVPYSTRMLDLQLWHNKQPKSTQDKVTLLIPAILDSVEQLTTYEEDCLSKGYEGVMTRRLDGVYKCNRSTPKEQILLKLKRFTDAEAIVINFEERMHNENPKEKDAFGNSKRSSHQENKSGANTLGALVVEDKEKGITFRIGTGFNDELRKEIWNNKDKYLGKIVTYKSQPSGALNAPRFPVYLSFKGFRSPLDMD